MIRFKYYMLVLRYKLITWLQTKRRFRKWIGGSWYFVCDIDSGDEFWIQEEPNLWLVVVVTEEHWNEQ